VPKDVIEAGFKLAANELLRYNSRKCLAGPTKIERVSDAIKSARAGLSLGSQQDRVQS
jgi:hypothetical protein